MSLFKRISTLAFSLLMLLPVFLSAQGKSQTEIIELFKTHTRNLNFSEADINDVIVTDDYTSRGIRHLYFKQGIAGIEVFNSTADIHIKGDETYFSRNQFIRGINKDNPGNVPGIEATTAIRNAANQKGYDAESEIITLETSQKPNRETVFSAPDLSHNKIKARLVYFAREKEGLALAWNFAIDAVSGDDYFNFIVDANTGEIIHEINWMVNCDFGHTSCKAESHSHSHEEPYNQPKYMAPNTYNVFAMPVESPNYGNRSIETSPWLANTTASPNGWHMADGNSYTTSRGNNVDAYDDSNGSNNPSNGDNDRADGGVDLEFDFPWVSNGDPEDYKDAAITNLFYINNIVHDVMYNYGFDEASGNFQQENYGPDGSDEDYVRAEAQDGGGSCNARFGTPPDGSRPRMQMYLCGNRDGDFDNGVIIHEYGHGISNRLTGGPNNTNCLWNREQMGEGWSDFYGCVLSIEPGDVGTDARPVGTWLFNQGPNGNGIRPFPYSTDFNVNPLTYGSTISGLSIPHGIGSVWTTILWEMTWALIDEHGFDPDIYNGTGGNNIALHLVTEGLKLQACTPGFVDGRDAIIQADQMLYNGANFAILWEAFAKRGLGYSASQGSSASLKDAIEAFDLPPSISIELVKTSSVNATEPCNDITYTLTATNNYGSELEDLVVFDPLPENTTFVHASDGGIVQNDTIFWPSFSLDIDESKSVSFTANIVGATPSAIPDFDDDMESGTDNWNVLGEGSTNWNMQNTTFNSATNAWFAPDNGSPGIAFLTVALPQGIGSTTEFIFNHFYDTEADWDGGLVTISLDNGLTWTDLGDDFTQNGYNSTIYNAIPGYSGNSGGFIESRIDLSPYTGKLVLIRFEMHCDQFVAGNGWFIDDVSIVNLSRYIPNTATISNGTLISKATLEIPTEVLPLALDAVISSNNLSCSGTDDGEAQVTAKGGTGSYTYMWDNGTSNDFVKNLTPGTYNVTVDDGATSIVRSVTIETYNPTVNTTQDFISGSLRAVLDKMCVADTLRFDPGLSGETILLSGTEITLNQEVAIKGLGMNDLDISGSNNGRIFDILSGTPVYIENITLSHSQKDTDGGAIKNEGDLILKDVILEENYQGSGVRPMTNTGAGTVTITDSVQMKR